jgi:hypothetical protein
MIVRIVLIAVAVLVLFVAGYLVYMTQITNPRVERDLIDNPDGKRARRVMLLTLPSGRRLPVNYLREGNLVFAGADGRWWKELVGEGLPVSLVVRGESLEGTGRAVLDDPAYSSDVFKRLRPDAFEGFGTLVEIQLD